MEQTLKITNVLSDPTRYYIYQHITKRHSEVTVQEIAETFEIHPNVARLHLTKLEDVNMLVSETKKTGKGGRPSRLYRLSDDVIQLHFPFRDYQLLAKISIQTMLTLGDAGRDALYATGKSFGVELAKQQLAATGIALSTMPFSEKLVILKEAATIAGFYPEFAVDHDESIIHFKIFNCPFKEIATDQSETVCGMHHAFLQGMFESVFTSVQLIKSDSMMNGCDMCSYQALIAN